jgi:hypothetical protein
MGAMQPNHGSCVSGDGDGKTVGNRRRADWRRSGRSIQIDLPSNDCHLRMLKLGTGEAAAQHLQPSGMKTKNVAIAGIHLIISQYEKKMQRTGRPVDSGQHPSWVSGNLKLCLMSWKDASSQLAGCPFLAAFIPSQSKPSQANPIPTRLLAWLPGWCRSFRCHEAVVELSVTWLQ